MASPWALWIFKGHWCWAQDWIYNVVAAQLSLYFLSPNGIIGGILTTACDVTQTFWWCSRLLDALLISVGSIDTVVRRLHIFIRLFLKVSVSFSPLLANPKERAALGTCHMLLVVS